jgi:hypothetical protein
MMTTNNRNVARDLNRMDSLESSSKSIAFNCSAAYSVCIAWSFSFWFSGESKVASWLDTVVGGGFTSVVADAMVRDRGELKQSNPELR